MAGRGRAGLTGMAAVTAIVSIAYSLGVGRYWIAAVAVGAVALCFNWSSGKVDPGKLLTIGRFLAKHLFRAYRTRQKGTAGWGTVATTPKDDPAAGVDRKTLWAWGKAVGDREGQAVAGVTLVEIGAVATLLELEPRPRLSVKRSAAFAESADILGFAIEPDVRVDHTTYAWDQTVAIYRTTPKSGPPRDPRYFGAALILELGLYVAAADGTVDAKEIDGLATFIENHFTLALDDAKRIEALKILLDKSPPASLAGLGKEIQTHLTAAHREQVGQILVGVAAADGSVGKREVSALRTAYRSLGLDSGVLDALLTRLQAPVMPAATPSQISVEAGVAIDPARLAKVLGETRDVARILGEAVRDADIEETVAAPPVLAPPTVATDDRFPGLDARYHAALGELLTRSEWTRAEFDTIARRHNLMPSSAIEVMNEWSQDRLGDLVLEPIGDDEGLGVQAHLLSPPTVTRS